MRPNHCWVFCLVAALTVAEQPTHIVELATAATRLAPSSAGPAAGTARANSRHLNLIHWKDSVDVVHVEYSNTASTAAIAEGASNGSPIMLLFTYKYLSGQRTKVAFTQSGRSI